jgi:NAD(P)-dependent dehydrogenase (short-subunit alcohol dehydrogenase family)
MNHVFFTGATGDLGGECVKQLSESGRWVVFAAGTNHERLKQLETLVNVIPVRCDITNQDSVETARETVEGITKKLDAIVNFAGLTAFSSAVEGEIIKTTEKILAVNVMGMVRVNRVFFDMIDRTQGRIINCSSEAGWMTAQPFAAPYFLSKRAVEAYSDSLRRELMFLGIRVIKMQPGSFKTRITENIYRDFDKTLESTRYHKDLLARMKPLMVHELKNRNDPSDLARLLLKALESKHPKNQYRIGTGKLLLLLEILPERWVDASYRLFFRLRR